MVSFDVGSLIFVKLKGGRVWGSSTALVWPARVIGIDATGNRFKVLLFGNHETRKYNKVDLIPYDKESKAKFNHLKKTLKGFKEALYDMENRHHLSSEKCENDFEQTNCPGTMDTHAKEDSNGHSQSQSSSSKQKPEDINVLKTLEEDCLIELKNSIARAFPDLKSVYLAIPIECYREMAEKLPTSKAELQEIEQMTHLRVEKYGAHLLQVCKDFNTKRLNYLEEKQSAQMLANQEEASTFSQAVLSTPPAKLKKKKARKSRWSNGFVSKPNRKLKPKDTSDKDDENSKHNNDGRDTDKPWLWLEPCDEPENTFNEEQEPKLLQLQQQRKEQELKQQQQQEQRQKLLKEQILKQKSDQSVHKGLKHHQKPLKQEQEQQQQQKVLSRWKTLVLKQQQEQQRLQQQQQQQRKEQELKQHQQQKQQQKLLKEQILKQKPDQSVHEGLKQHQKPLKQEQEQQQRSDSKPPEKTKSVDVGKNNLMEQRRQEMIQQLREFKHQKTSNFKKCDLSHLCKCYQKFSSARFYQHLLAAHFKHVREEIKDYVFPHKCNSCNISLKNFQDTLDHAVEKHLVLDELYVNEVMNLEKEGMKIVPDPDYKPERKRPKEIKKEENTETIDGSKENKPINKEKVKAFLPNNENSSSFHTSGFNASVDLLEDDLTNEDLSFLDEDMPWPEPMAGMDISKKWNFCQDTTEVVSTSNKNGFGFGGMINRKTNFRQFLQIQLDALQKLLPNQDRMVLHDVLKSCDWNVSSAMEKLKNDTVRLETRKRVDVNFENTSTDLKRRKTENNTTNLPKEVPDENTWLKAEVMRLNAENNMSKAENMRLNAENNMSKPANMKLKAENLRSKNEIANLKAQIQGLVALTVSKIVPKFEQSSQTDWDWVNTQLNV